MAKGLHGICVAAQRGAKEDYNCIGHNYLGHNYICHNYITKEDGREHRRAQRGQSTWCGRRHEGRASGEDVERRKFARRRSRVWPTGMEAGVEAGMEADMEASMQADMDAGMDAGMEAGMEVGVEAGAEAGM